MKDKCIRLKIGLMQADFEHQTGETYSDRPSDEQNIFQSPFLFQLLIIIIIINFFF